MSNKNYLTPQIDFAEWQVTEDVLTAASGPDALSGNDWGYEDDFKSI